MVSFLTTRVKRPYEGDWGKLNIVLKYLKGTNNTKLTMRVEYLSLVKWWIYDPYNTHGYFRGRTGFMMILVRGLS